MLYPTWTYFPAYSAPPVWVTELAAAVAAAEGAVASAARPVKHSSDRVLADLRPGLEAMGFTVETGKKRSEKIERPVLFGENGAATVHYEIDAYHPVHKVVLELELGRGVRSNAAYRDLVRTSLIHDADYLALLMPLEYRHKQGDKTITVNGYHTFRDQLGAIYASNRLHLPFAGILLLGY